MQAAVAVSLLALVILGGLFPRTVRWAPQQPVLRAEVMSLPGLGGASAPLRVTDIDTPYPAPVSPAGATRSAAAVRSADDDAATSPTPRSEEGDSQDGEADRPDEQLPFFRYDIQDGDTVIGIALRFNIDVNYIVWNNIDTLPNADLLRPGQQLRIPSVEGIIHDVLLGETLIEIADIYDADVDEIVAFPANDLANPDELREGSTILVPGGRVVARLRQPRPTPTPQALSSVRPPPTPEPTETTSTFGFVWPASGRITSWFGPTHPLGIDVAMPNGTAVRAAAAGQVTFVGGHACCSYGYYVVIKHDETFTSRYAHFSRFNVTLGEWVEQGEVIGWSGTTGASTGPHLHLEIRRKGEPQNPLLYLP